MMSDKSYKNENMTRAQFELEADYEIDFMKVYLYVG